MLSDCEKRKIDIILTNSIQRIARHTVDLLNTVRHLKEKGTKVRFEKESINTLSGDGELMLSILASFAQEEARSISENYKWGVRKRFQTGEISNNAHHVLDQEGYNARFQTLTDKSENLEMRYAETSNKIIIRHVRRQKINLFLQHLREKDLLTEFKDEDWISMVNFITVNATDNITVTFKDGTEIQA